MSRKRDPITPAQGEEIFGGSLLNRIGTGAPVLQSSERQKSMESKRQDDIASKRQHIKISLYLPPEDVDALDELLLKLRKERKEKLDRSGLIRRAITQLLESKH
jgi:hypothetical protein